MSQGAATYLPIRLLQAGVIPIIFALSLLLLPQMGLSMLGAIHVGWASSAAIWYTAFLSNPWQYGAIYFILVVLFTYFYTAVTFEPHRIADNLDAANRELGRRYVAVATATPRLEDPSALFL